MKLSKRDFLLLAVVIYFTFIGGTFYSQLNFFLRVANQIIATVILGVWLFGRLKQKEGLPRTLLDVGLALYVFVNFAGAIFGQSPRFSLEMLWFTLIHALTFYFLVDLIRRGWGPKLVWAIYMAAAVVCLIGLIEFLAWYVGTPLFGLFSQGWVEIGGWRHPIPPHIYRLNITLNGSTPLAAYLALLIPPAIGLILTLPRRSENRRALILWLALAMIVEVLTFSRAGILALAVSLLILAVGWWRVSGKQGADVVAHWRGLNSILRVVILAGLVIGAGLGLFWVQHSFAHRIQNTNFRFTLWQAAFINFQDYWLTGVGPGNFGRALLRLNDPAFPRHQISTAHSIYFNTAAELGIIGLLAGAYLYLLAAYSWLKHFRQLTTPAGKIRLIAAGGALVGLAAQVLVDTYTATPNMLIMLALLAYIAAPPSLTAERRPTLIDSPVSSASALALLLIYLAAFFWIGRADLRYQNSFHYEQAGHLEEAIAQAEKSAQLDPRLTLRLFRLALLEARLAYRTGDAAAAQSAIEHYQAGLQQEPIYGLNSANLAGLLWQQGQQSEAIALMERSAAAEENSQYRLNLGYFYEQQQEFEKATAVYGELLAKSPQWAGSDFWQASDFRAEQWNQFVGRAVEYVSAAGPAARQDLQVQLALAREELAALETVAETTQNASALLQEAQLTLALNQGQAQQFETLLAAMPDNANKYLWRGRAALQSGNFTAAETQLKTATFLGNQTAWFYLGQLYEQQGNLEAAKNAYHRALVFTTSENVEVTIYGRLGANDLAPQLIRISGRPGNQPGFALIKLYNAEQNTQNAQRVLNLLKEQDHFLEEPGGEN